jgi:hypothetical protein
LNPIIQRLVARSTQEGTNNFNKILDMITEFTESLEQNKLNEYY